MGHSKLEIMKQESRDQWKAHEPQGWRIRWLGQGSPKKLVKAHENAELESGPKMLEESKWAKDAQE